MGAVSAADGGRGADPAAWRRKEPPTIMPSWKVRSLLRCTVYRVLDVGNGHSLEGCWLILLAFATICVFSSAVSVSGTKVRADYFLQSLLALRGGAGVFLAQLTHFLTLDS